MCASVVGAIAPTLEQAEIERSKRKPTERLDAYDYCLRGMAAFNEWTAEANVEATDLGHLCDSITEDVITGLGRFRSLFVIDRHSSAVASQQPFDIAEIGRRLGVAYLI